MLYTVFGNRTITTWK